MPDAAPVEFVSQAGGDPSSVSFDAVVAGRARGCDVVIADTAGRLPTQLHLMEELKKIKRSIHKAQAGAPHEVLLVIDGNTGQNALNQVKAFDEALQLTGLIITKLDGTAKGGVLAAIALWGRERAASRPGLAAVPVYFIGVGEQLEDLQTFRAREFAQRAAGLSASEAAGSGRAGRAGPLSGSRRPGRPCPSCRACRPCVSSSSSGRRPSSSSSCRASARTG